VITGRLRIIGLALGAVALASGGPRAQSAPAIPPTAETAYRAVSTRFQRDGAMRTVEFMQQYWRLAANPGFDASIDYIRQQLTEARLPVLQVEEYRSNTPGWDYAKGTVSIVGDPTPVLSKERDRVSLAINSFSTPPEGLTTRLVDVGAGSAADFGDNDVKGAVVLGDAPLNTLWREAVRNRGAAGVISTQIAKYIRPDDPAQMSDAQKDVLQWGNVPYDEKTRAFGFKASWRAGARLREALKKNPRAQVRVEIVANFYSGPARMLVAEIPGRTVPNERIVMAAHLQEPGASDDASGCATLYALARALQEAIAQGALPPPERTLTFLWVDEIRGSRQWLTAHPDEARGVQYMFSMDMTGEDTTKTGGTFLIEKQADPSAVWVRPSDPHSEWGASEVKQETLKGSLLNDVHLAIANRRARDTGWVVRTNPYEGGSDHTVFAGAGVPSLLNWHFTDRFYHTSQDTTDKVSGAEMENVGIVVATSAYLLASANERDALAVLDLLARGASARLDLERRQGAELVAKASDRAAAEGTESQVIAAWIKWYREAMESVSRLPTSGPSDTLTARIAAAQQRVK
jgi:Zn-dependent M28 family amino/carboxypeptidase